MEIDSYEKVLLLFFYRVKNIKEWRNVNEKRIGENEEDWKR